MKDQKTLGERMMEDERAARKSRVEARLSSERRARWEAIGTAVAVVVLIFAVIFVSLGALWVAVKVVRIAWES